MDVSENSGTPKSCILIGFSIINHPFWGYPYFWNPPYLPCFGCFESPSFCWSYPLGLAAKARAFELGAKTLVPGGAERRVLPLIDDEVVFRKVDEKAKNIGLKVYRWMIYNTHTDDSSTWLSGVVRGRGRLSHRPLLKHLLRNWSYHSRSL